MGENLTPLDVVECTAAYGSWIRSQTSSRAKVVVGRDARISGAIVHQLVVSTLMSQGIDVIDLGLSTTPTVELMVKWEQAAGGIILTASHNPKEWNALKFLNQYGEFISSETGIKILSNADNKEFTFSSVDDLGTVRKLDNAIERHIDHVFTLPHVNRERIRGKSYKVAVDAINSTGAISIVPLLEALGCEVICLHAEMTGDFAHNPEPLPAHLKELAEAVTDHQCDLGITVDPDVDRLAFVCEDGSIFGEEYTIVALAEHILSHAPGGSTVSNLSSTMALRVLTESHGGRYFASAVGEVNVVRKMKECQAIFGGEGNGGVIYPPSHYGRDALVGVALFLTMMAERNLTPLEIRAILPSFFIAKRKVLLTPNLAPDDVLSKLAIRHSDTDQDRTDGLKLLYQDQWVHMRKSNTEPIIRVYAESKSEEKAADLADKFVAEIKTIS